MEPITKKKTRPKKQTIEERLAAIRQKMDAEGIDALLIPHADAYQGEYLPACAERLRFLTGFSGSAGYAVLLKDRAAVFSDGRYTLQLAQEVDSDFFETGDSTKITAAEWIAGAMSSGGVVGIDPWLHTQKDFAAFEKKNLAVRFLETNLIDLVWTDRPAPPSTVVQAFPLSYAGVSAQEKVKRLCEDLQEKGACDAALLSLSDSIAWLLNIRAGDIPHNPVALSYALIDVLNATVVWFIEPSRIETDVRLALGSAVCCRPLEDLASFLSSFAAGKRILLDERETPLWFAEKIKESGGQIVWGNDPCIGPKARKNDSEIFGMREAHTADAVAIVRFLHWLSKQDTAQRSALTEWDVVEVLESFRRHSPLYKEPSFATIAGYGPNGAIIHYHPHKDSAHRLAGDGLLLLDSGGQYAGGTTDITRTLILGRPDAQMIKDYTLVLKAHVAVATARFPKGTTGAQIDALARAPLWAENLDYAHGTGHGVGCYLCVHEAAAPLSPRGHEAVEAGMVLSNEPGCYREGRHGVRLENLELVCEEGACVMTGRPMYRFQELTLLPFAAELVDFGLLTLAERQYLAAYHHRIENEISIFLQGEEKEFLSQSCRKFYTLP